MAVPSEVVTVTDVGTSIARDNVIVKIAGVPSVVVAFDMLKSALSLFVIVPVAAPFVPEIVTLRPPAFSPPSVAVKVSSASTFVSVVVLTVTVFVVEPAGNEMTCPVTAV